MGRKKKKRYVRTSCGKRGFLTYGAALEAVTRNTIHPSATRQEQRIYKCDSCGFWHLSSS